MRKCAGFLLAMIFCAAAAAQQRIIPRLGRAPHSAAQAYTLVKNYLSDPLRGGFFRIVRADPANHLLVVKRDRIDSQNWNNWAYCKLGPQQLLYNLEDGTATVTVKITPSGKSFSDVSVTADFKGTYGLAGNQTTAQCVSKGVLEEGVLQAVGAPPQGT